MATAPLSTLPRHLTSFVNREAELRALKPLVRGSRIVTLIGTGGAGKSRLAAEVAKANHDAWPDGAWWIELAAETGVGGAVVASLELPGRGAPEDVVASWLATRRALLILDNCEHLIAECARFSQLLLERCPELTILATSRESIGVPGEVRWPVASLGDPEAVALFEARARLVSPEFKVGPDNREPVVAICSRLDGLPLAIEMAAARLDLMSERELLANLNDRFQLLASGARTVPERQQTMAAAIDWSYRLLTTDEGQLFRRLAVFHGGFTLEAARAVCSDADGREVLDILRRLVQKSMVVADRLDDGTTRYRLMESHQDFARERLVESGEVDQLQRRHYEHFQARPWTARDSANYWAAAAWARDNTDDAGLGLALDLADSEYWDQTRARSLLTDRIARAPARTATRARALSLAARIASRQGDHATGRVLADESLTLARDLGDPDLVADALRCAGAVYHAGSQMDVSTAMYDEALDILENSANRPLAIEVQNQIGLIAIEQGDFARAQELLQECVAFSRTTGELGARERYLESLANAQLGLGDVQGAAASWTESLSISRDLNDHFGSIWSLGGLALIAAARRDDERALRLTAAVARLSRELSLNTWPHRIGEMTEIEERVRGKLGPRKSQAIWDEGQGMTRDRALEYALGVGTPATPAADVGPLSRREREVAAMVAAGLTNRQIAQRLFIAERTAEGHVERIRNKLGVRSRTEVATWAIAHGLVDLPH